ncbi:hypothetical protein R3I93_006533 [Phoxinus phoxinus]|uniref:Immunoglobulin domain-containing protein n=1 Tax=Phoxinus phoxinus TaxID=58324 RepID=A0AAN9HEI2_9TELE
MLLRRYFVIAICGVFIASGAVSGEEVVKAVGDQVSFKLDTIVPSVTSITWKHIKDGVTVKAIEWEEGEATSTTPNPRFQGITTLNKETGQITITKLTVEHSGVYTIDVSGKEQTQKFTLTVMEPVPKPEIKIKQTANPGFVYLSCEYTHKIIWKNSTGETLTGSKIEKGESLTVQKNGNPENFYTCTLENAASSKTSERVYERDLFEDESSGGSSAVIIVICLILVLLLIGIICAVFLYKRNEKFQKFVVAKFSKGTETAEDKSGNVSKHLNPDENKEAEVTQEV